MGLPAGSISTLSKAGTGGGRVRMESGEASILER